MATTPPPSGPSGAQSQREQRFARAVDREVAPMWHDRFARMIYRRLPRGADAFALDVHCGPGRTTFELLERLGSGTRVLALEPDGALRNLAKHRMRPDWKGRVYLKDGALADVAGMGTGTYDLVIANLVLGDVQGFEESLRELVRVTKPGGHVLATLPLAGTWAEVEDLFRLVLLDASLRDADRRLRHLARLRPTGPGLARAMAALGVGPQSFVIEQERASLLFASGREFLFSPVIEHGPLRLWKAILGAHEKPQELFWKLKEAIDAYHADGVFSVSVVLGLLHISVPQPGATTDRTPPVALEHWKRYPQLDRLFTGAEQGDADEDIDIDIDEDDDEDDVEIDAPVTHELSPSSSAVMSAEDEAIFALLEQPGGAPDGESSLDALLDQVLEYAGPRTETTVSDDLELKAIVPEEDVPRPGETLKRIKSLLPPPPSFPPPPPRGRRGGKR